MNAADVTAEAVERRHLDLLEAAAIPPEVAVAAGVRSVTDRADLPAGLRWAGPGLLFHYHPLDGPPVPQYRPDSPTADAEGRARKYLFPRGPVPLNVVPAMSARLGTAETVLLVEGTKQTLTAVAHAPDGVLVVGMAGCWGWSADGMGTPELGRLGIAGRPVVVAFDADLASNPNVRDAAARLAKHLDLIGAAGVTFLRLPASGAVGLDDFLACQVDPGAVLARLIAKAGALPKRPKRSDPSGAGRFFDATGLLVEDLAAAILEAGHYAVGPDGAIWRYSNGAYVDSESMVSAARDHLGNRFRDMHLRNLKLVMADELRRRDLVLGDQETAGLINVRNGMLRIATGELEPHDPAHLSRTQLAIDWDATAVCRGFDAWLTDRCGTQAEDLLEAAGLMLTPWIGQRRVLFLFGPTRSGKGTFLRLLEAIAGAHTAAVTLEELATNRFAAADLYGAMLNVAGDLSDHHIDDLSTFKQLTGDDLVAGERKYRDRFTFRNRAMFAFSANTPPTVSETSRAYLARVRPYLFPLSFEGAEDPGTDDRLAEELPGILVRLVEGARRWIARGGYLPGDPMVADEFAQQSDVAALFAAQATTAKPGGFTSGKAMFDTYRDWADANGRGCLGRNKFLARMESALGARERAEGDNTGPTGWRNVRVLHADQWVDADPLARFAFFFSPLAHEEKREEGEREGAEPREGGVREIVRTVRALEPAPVPAGDDTVELKF